MSGEDDGGGREARRDAEREGVQAEVTLLERLERELDAKLPPASTYAGKQQRTAEIMRLLRVQLFATMGELVGEAKRTAQAKEERAKRIRQNKVRAAERKEASAGRHARSVRGLQPLLQLHDRHCDVCAGPIHAGDFKNCLYCDNVRGPHIV